MTSDQLQMRLEKCLRANLDVNGSPEYALTWKRWDMQSGPPICALRASARRTSVKGFSGWPTPCGQDGPHGGPNQGLDRLPGMANVAGWATPRVTTGKYCYSKGDKGKKVLTLDGQANVAGWSTPTASDCKGSPTNAWTRKDGTLRNDRLDFQAALSGTTQSGSHAATEKRGVLNPDLSRWLMGYTAEHLSCGVTAMRLCHKSRRNS